MTTIFRATLETRSFHFEAFGSDHDSAWAALVQGLKRHGKQYRIAADWFGEFIGDIEVTELALDVAYRDRQVIP